MMEGEEEGGGGEGGERGGGGGRQGGEEEKRPFTALVPSVFTPSSDVSSHNNQRRHGRRGRAG